MEMPNRRTVLYVEDHPINALLMAAIFEHRPELELVVAATGTEALARARALQPTLLLLDLGLPDIHGSDLLQKLRNLPGYGRLPAVAVTAHTDYPVERAGFRELWAKPLLLEDVLPRLDALTSAQSAPPTASPGGWPLSLASA